MDSAEAIARSTGTTIQSSHKYGHMSPGELELTGRILLGNTSAFISPSASWSYSPKDNEIFYPAMLLDKWDPNRMVGGICHEIAEMLFTGKPGHAAIELWLESMIDAGYSIGGLSLLVTTFDDLRVNQCYMAKYPGSSTLFKDLYGKNDTTDIISRVEVTHVDVSDMQKQYLASIERAWLDHIWPKVSIETATSNPQVNKLVLNSFNYIKEAISASGTIEMLDVLERYIVQQYNELSYIDETIEDRSQIAARDLADQPNCRSEGNPQDFFDTNNAESMPQANPENDSQSIRSTEQTSVSPTLDAASQQKGAQTGDVDHIEIQHADPWSSSLVTALKQNASDEERIDYTKFEYSDSVRKLRKEINDTVDGDAQRPGLAYIMNRRRHGSSEAHRRPRKQRSGDLGDIDTDHPERVLTDPMTAFLRGIRVPREDRQRDFAGLILLDISGSMVQKGYPTKKFDRLVETATLFIEIHERLRIPFEVIAFSSEVTSLWSFDDCTWPKHTATDTEIELGAAVRDHTDIFRKLYELDHKDTDDAAALRLAIDRAKSQEGIKSIFIITDGISSDPSHLRRTLMDLDRNNRNSSEAQRIKVIAFGVGVVKSEFQLAYQPTQHGKPLNSCSGVVIEDVSLLPRLVRKTVDDRIRNA